MDGDTFKDDLSQNILIGEVLDRARGLDVSDMWLAGGCLFQTVWNVLSGNLSTKGIKDYDLFYFDPDLSWRAEDKVIGKARAQFSDLDIDVEIRNQARVHCWYPEKFGCSYPELSRSTDGIDRFLMVCAMVGVQQCERAGLKLYAPRGVEDIYRFEVRPNPASPMGSPERYAEKAGRWTRHWPRLKIFPWPKNSHGKVS